MRGMSTDDGGLRERKKRATRQALSAAALRLAREHGPQNVRVDDIAEAAALRERPADEPLEHAVVGALIEQYSDDGEPDRDTLALINSAPALQAEFLDSIAAIERPLAEAIAARTDPDGQGELGPEVLAAAVSGAARIAAERWLQPDPDTTFSVMLSDALIWILPALRAADR